MKRKSVRGLLFGLVLALALMPNIASKVKADEIGNCGMPYSKQRVSYYWWGKIPVPYLKTQACADCDGGTYCYDIGG